MFDAGFNGGFLIQSGQYQQWSWLPPDLRVDVELPPYRHGDGKGNVELVPRWKVSLWVYPNVPGSITVAPGSPPFLLEVPDDSVFFTPPNSQLERRMPLVGMRAIRVNRLDVRMDSDRGVFALAAP